MVPAHRAMQADSTACEPASASTVTAIVMCLAMRTLVV
jgi:hypothetical protein